MYLYREWCKNFYVVFCYNGSLTIHNRNEEAELLKRLLGIFMILSVTCCAALADTEINSDNFPDERFREIVGNFDTNNDGTLQDSEADSVETITVRGMSISSLDGISAFRNLKTLRCGSNDIVSLDLSGNTLLESVACDSNQIAHLDISSCVALVSLDCHSNNLSELDISNSTSLRFLDCSDNNFGSSGLNVSHLSELRHLWCWNDSLTELDVTSNDKLESLICYGNNFTSLNLAGNPFLTELSCGGNPIADSMNINNLLPMMISGDNCVLLQGLSNNGNIGSADIRAFDADGEALALTDMFTENELVYAVFAGTPAIVRYQCDTGHERVNMSMTFITDTAEGFASCTNGIFEPAISGDIFMWKGIPYAKQPVGSLRWKAPEAPDASAELYEAFTYAPTPLQHNSTSNPFELMAPQGEDCLALNIWNNGITDALKPVMVWIHGGDFNSGGTSNPDYDGLSFVEAHNDVVLVSVGYRVGIMGFIDFVNSGLAGCENFPDSANLGLLDVLQALRWLQDNIIKFGGDPRNVTLFGQSSGAAMISLLMSMPDSAGLFGRAITESGAVSMTSGVDECAALTQELTRVTGADTMDALMSLSSADLQAASERLQAFMNFPQRDGRLVAENPYEAFAVNSASFDLLAGSNADEVLYWSLAMESGDFTEMLTAAFQKAVDDISAVDSDDGEIPHDFINMYLASHDEGTELDAVTEFFNDLLFRGPVVLEAENHEGRKYVYYWEQPSGMPGAGACHAAEIPYVLNHDSVTLSVQVNRTLAEAVQAMWVNFARTGNPSTDTITWPEYDNETQATMIITESPSVRNGNLREQYECIRPLLDYGITARVLISAAADTQETETPDVEHGATDTVTPGSGTGSPEFHWDPDGTSHDVDGTGDDAEHVAGDAASNDVGSSSGGGGCNSGFMFTMMIAVTAFIAAKRR